MSYNLFSNTDKQGNIIVNSQGYGTNSSGADLSNRLKVSTPFTVFSWKQDFLQRTDLMSNNTGGSGSVTFNANPGSTTLTVTTSSSDMAVLLGQYPAPAQPGQTLRWRGSAVLGTGQTNTVARVGPHTANNGAFFCLNGTTKQVVTRTYSSGSAVDTAVAQSSWNIDPLDGTGPSGLTINWSNFQNFVIEINQTAGIVNFGFNLGGSIVYCHQVNNCIGSTATTISPTVTAYLPAKFSLANTGSTAGSYSITVYSTSLEIEGDPNQYGSPFGINVTTAKAMPIYSSGLYGNETCFFQIKPISGVGAVPLLLTSLSINELEPSSGGNSWVGILQINIRKNPTFGTGGTGSTFSNVATNSLVQYDIANTNTVSGGTLLANFSLAFSDDGGGSGPGSGGVNTPIQIVLPQPIMLLGENAAGTSDVIVVSVSNYLSFGSGSTGISTSLPSFGSMTWIEYV